MANLDGQLWRTLRSTAAWSVIASLTLIVSVVSGTSALSPAETTGVGGASPDPSGSGQGPSTGSSVGPSPSGGSYLDGTASFDLSMVRAFFKYERNINLPAAPVSFANQDKVKAVNSEFAKRIEVLFAVYQASGGATEFGIEPDDGGLRTKEKQIELFKECRRIKKGPDPSGRRHMPYDLSDGPKVGDGNKPEDWEVIPVDERITSMSHPVWTMDEQGKLIVVKYDHEHLKEEKEQNCGLIRRMYHSATGGDYTEVFGPVTNVWFSWHNVGLAVDLRQMPQVAIPPISNNGAGWVQMEQAMGDLGMTHGGWWPCFPDVGHVEWHPKLHDPKRFESQGGSALGNEMIDMGFRWKIPSQIYIWYRLVPPVPPPGVLAVPVPIPPRPNHLTVLDLVADGEWVSVKKQRVLRGYQNEEWEGTWETFYPPIPLFPAYIPTMSFGPGLTGSGSPLDVINKTGVTRLTVTAQGKAVKEMIEQKGEGFYRPYEVRVFDWQKQANIFLEQNKGWEKCGKKTAPHPDGPRFEKLRDASIYSVHASVLDPGGTSHSPVLERRQGVDSQGHTTDESNINIKGHLGATTGLCLVWNRDTGAIGGMLDQVPPGDENPLEIREQSHSGTVGIPSMGGHVEDCGERIVSAQLPSGVWDMETPPAWLPSNPRPKQTAPPPPPGSILVP